MEYNADLGTNECSYSISSGVIHASCGSCNTSLLSSDVWISGTNYTGISYSTIVYATNDLGQCEYVSQKAASNYK